MSGQGPRWSAGWGASPPGVGSGEGEKGGNRGAQTGVASLAGTREMGVFAWPERVGSGGQRKGRREVWAQVQVGKEVWWEPEEYLIIFKK